MIYLVGLAFVFLFLPVNPVQSRSSLELERNILNTIFDGYDPTIRPAGANGTGPVVVTVNIYVRSLSNMDDVNMVYDAQLTFRQAWSDSRLRYDAKGLRSKSGNTYVNVNHPERLWIPDLFFANEASGHFHNMITPNNLIRIYPNGTILYSTRVSLRLFCPMDLRNYPMDNQICSIKCASYGYTTEDIIFLWKKNDPVQIAMSSVSNLPKFTMNVFMTDYCNSKTNTGEYSCVKLDMSFSRNIFYYLESAFMPTAALVLLSWVIFWLNPRCTNVRLGIWIGILISIIIVTTSINDNSPEVSYTKALDVWMGVCVFFIFCVLLELCLVNDAITNEDKTLALKTNSLWKKSGLRIYTIFKGNRKNSSKMDEGKGVELPNYKATPLRWLNKYSTRAQRIDVVSRFLFPAAFAFFNFIYWITYSANRE
ncbi:glutamate-gated chloride channel [Caerostris extrusa]|uniref:Glutamate-gated chloride channel n=1 Tax=Caerostris extrusa TaxID=172846 RepID=A0AAV4T416_CAEEX|nr:glutamate-gated chloride channel [Caerostris extrusa]